MPRKNQIINLTIVLATSSIYVAAHTRDLDRSFVSHTGSINLLQIVLMWKVQQHMPDILLIYLHIHFLYIPKKKSRKRWDIWQKDRIL